MRLFERYKKDPKSGKQFYKITYIYLCHDISGGLISMQPLQNVPQLTTTLFITVIITFLINVHKKRTTNLGVM